MRVWIRLLLFFLVLAPTPPSASGADAASACQQARDGYRSASAALADALQTYSTCLQSSHGQDDCALPFVDLEAAQKAFEEAVQAKKEGCSKRLHPNAARRADLRRLSP